MYVKMPKSMFVQTLKNRNNNRHLLKFINHDTSKDYYEVIKADNNLDIVDNTPCSTNELQVT